ncbi:MAG: ABC transporter ATP-binding protein [Caulobacterales bacterium]|nr:ABC transporter ATP-binding protein [Caulobacterales bacterium]
MSAAIEVVDALRLYGSKAAVDGVSLSLQAGRITCLLGPSGCGKSTLLRMIAGLEPLDGGRVLSEGEDISTLPPERRDIGLVFQDYALFPHLRIEDNVGFGLAHLTSAERRERVADLLSTVRLADRARSFPGELSGGEQQRVALVRALARAPRAVLLDEPFSGLDGHLQAEVRAAALAILKQSGAAVLIVTHDAGEAMQMADDLALMAQGRILQRGSPEACYRTPVSIAAARLLGEAEVIAARISGGVAHTVFGPLPADGLADGEAEVMLRPTALVPGSGVQASVSEARFVGQGWIADLTSGNTRVQVRLQERPGEVVNVSIDPGQAHIFA